MCNIILQHNVFLKNMAIGHIVNIQDKDVDKVNIFDTSLHFSCWESTKQATKGKFQLITNKSVVNNAQKEVKNLLEKYYGILPNNNTSETLGRMKKYLQHNRYLNYAVALFKNVSTITHNMTITTPPNYKRPSSILFNFE